MLASVRLSVVLAVSLTAGSGVVFAEKKYGPGVTDTEIKIGQTMPYSGPGSAYGTIGKSEVAYFKMINDQGGINGRKINLISLDDGYSPPRTVEQIRKLVEEDQVLLTFQTLGTAANTAIQKYMNAKKVPQLFVATGATKWGDPEHFPWTMGWQPTYQHESHIYAKYLLQTKPDAKIGILYQNDDYGKDYLKGFKDGLGDKAAKMIVAEVSAMRPPIPRSIRRSSRCRHRGRTCSSISPDRSSPHRRSARAYDIGWRPLQLFTSYRAPSSSVLQPAGLEKSVGVISVGYLKDPTDPAWKDDKAMKDYARVHEEVLSGRQPADVLNVYGYSAAQTLVQVLKQCGDDLTRENVMRQAANLKDLQPADAAAGNHGSTPARRTSILSSRSSSCASTARPGCGSASC